MFEPIRKGDSFIDDLVNVLLLRTVWRKPKPAPEPEPVEDAIERVFFYIVDRRVDGDEEVAVAVCKTRDRAVTGYSAMIDTALAAPTYAVRMFKAPMPEGANPDSADDATKAAYELAQADYRQCEQIAAFVRVYNTIMVDINKDGEPHLPI